MLEAVMLCIDDSGHSRDRDYLPSRLQAQQEAAIAVATAKLDANAENSVGLLTMAGEHVKVRAAPSGDMGAFHSAIQSVAAPADGPADLLKGIQTAQLALKHRLNRNQKQRIIVFVCSPLNADLQEVEKIGRALKKNNVTIDIVSFGEVAHNAALLNKLHHAVNSNNTSHILEVEQPTTLSRAILQSPMLSGRGAAQDGDFAGLELDPSADPELLMALRLSLEEERERQMRESARAGGAEQAAPAVASAAQPTAADDDRPPTVEEIENMDVDEDLRAALLLSLQTVEQEQQNQEFATPPDNLSFVSVSPRPSTEGVEAPGAGADASTAQQLSPEELRRLAEMLPGVDVHDPEVLAALQQIGGVPPPPAPRKPDDDKMHDGE